MNFRENVALPVALLCSVALHAVFIPVVYANKASMAHLPATKATHLDTPPVKDESVDLGLDKSTEATLTWIGYEEYEEQRARFAEVEQAEMQAEVDYSVPSPAQIAIEAARNLAEPIAQLSKELLEALQGIEITIPHRRIEVLPTEPVATPELQIETTPEPVVAPGVEAKEESASKGSPADRDSSATSTIKITPEQWKSGKPLAAKGIVLRPRRPSFTANQIVTNAPSDLVADLLINNKGKPTDVLIIYSTGSTSIDKSLISSLYRWRASGEKIDSLKDGETILISIHITFAK